MARSERLNEMEQLGKANKEERPAVPDDVAYDSRIAVSIIILTKNGEEYLGSLLEGLYCQNGIDLAEVIVIDSGSSDDTLGVISRFPRIRLVEIPPTEFGHGKTRNLGARLARGEFLVFLPQDATPVGNNWLGSLLWPFDDATIVGVFGRQVARANASPMETYFLARTYHQSPQTKVLGEGEGVSLARCFFSTVSGAIRASIWVHHPFREDIIMSEDQAWASEVMRDGHAIAYQPAAVVLHSHQYGVTDIFRRNFDSGYSIWQIYGSVIGIAPLAVLAELADEGAFVARNGSTLDWLRFVPYEAARHLGFWLGLRAEWLPGRLSRACSGLKYFWDRRGKGSGG